MNRFVEKRAVYVLMMEYSGTVAWKGKQTELLVDCSTTYQLSVLEGKPQDFGHLTRRQFLSL